MVEIVWPFINANISSPDWHLQEASLMVFGCLLHGPDPAFMASMVAEACPLLLGLISSDACLAVRDSAAWAISQVCESHLGSVPSELTARMLETLINSLDMVATRRRCDV